MPEYYRKVTKEAYQALESHQIKWNGCQLCRFGQNGGAKIFYRGVIPAEILFIAEAPGISEHSLRMPLVGPAGKKLDEIIRCTFERLERSFTVCMANTILCTPFDEDREFSTPKIAEIKACSPRLLEFIGIVQPKVIVRLGAIARKSTGLEVWYGVGKDRKCAKAVDLVHPSWILRQHEVPLETKKKIFDLANKLKEVL